MPPSSDKWSVFQNERRKTSDNVRIALLFADEYCQSVTICAFLTKRSVKQMLWNGCRCPGWTHSY